MLNGRGAIAALAVVSAVLVPATAGADAGGPGWSMYEQITATSAAAGAVSYGATIRLTGLPGLSGAIQRGFAADDSGYRVELLRLGARTVGVLDTEWYRGHAYLYGSQGGLVAAGLTPARAAVEVGRWIEAPAGSAFAARLADTLPLASLLSPYGPFGPVQLLGSSTVDGRLAEGVGSGAVGGTGGSFALWADSTTALPVRASAFLVGMDSDLSVTMTFSGWGVGLPIAAPLHPVLAATSWWSPSA